MAKLILSMDGLVLKEIPLTGERVTVGRKPHNDIQIDNLAVSGEHAAIVTILNDSFLEDLNSTNGTLVNGQAVKKHFLKNGDVIELSKYKLKYFADVATNIQTTDFGQTSPAMPQSAAGYSVRPKSAEEAPKDGVAGAGTASAGTRVLENPDLPPAAIRLLNGASAGRQLDLNRPLTSLGKHGVHAALIVRRPEGYVILQAEGSPSPEVNGKTMDKAELLLNDHDVIELAGIKMEFFLKA
ncbi:MAG: FHA domain-containing protein [Betaproteobacteria bacterium]|nr:FHA domain-containing protein [Betaproteobacteria bacterium]